MAFVLVHSMAIAVEITETSVKGKREAPMAEPSTDYLPPRLEAPYATYAPILTQNENIPQASIFIANAYGIPVGQSPFLDRIPAVPAVPVAGDASANAIGTELTPPPQQFNNLYDGSIPKYQGVLPLNNGGVNQGSFNNYPNAPNYPNVNYPNNANYPSANYPSGNLQSANYPSGNLQNANYPTNIDAFNNQFSSSRQFYRPQYGFSNGFTNGVPSGLTSSVPSGLSSGYSSTGAELPNGFLSSNSFTSNAALFSNTPAFATSTKGLSQYSSNVAMPKMYMKPVKNSRPIALTPSHLQRKPQPSFAPADTSGSFRPSFLLGSQYVTSTSDYKQSANAALGMSNQYLSSPSPQSSSSNQYVTRDTKSYIPPGTSYGVAETPFYMRESMKSSIFGAPYGKAQ